jgi:hypothetical protein
LLEIALWKVSMWREARKWWAYAFDRHGDVEFRLDFYFIYM